MACHRFVLALFQVQFRFIPMKILTDPTSGSYQGITASRNRFGQYRRTRATPVNPGSAYQLAVRARLQTNASNWRGLTDAQREQWAALGDQIQRQDSLGQYYTLTGFMAYLLVNNNKLAAGDATVSAAPLYDPPDPATSLTITATSASLSIAYTPTPLGAGIRAFVSASPPRSAGRAFEGDVRLIAVTAAAAASPANILAAYSARFGAPVTGSRIFVSLQLYNGGFLSTAIMGTAVVA